MQLNLTRSMRSTMHLALLGALGARDDLTPTDPLEISRVAFAELVAFHTDVSSISGLSEALNLADALTTYAIEAKADHFIVDFENVLRLVNHRSLATFALKLLGASARQGGECGEWSNAPDDVLAKRIQFPPNLWRDWLHAQTEEAPDYDLPLLGLEKVAA